MDILTGIFFQVSPCDANATCCVAVILSRDIEPAVFAERQIELTDLICLGKIGIVILFTVPLGKRSDIATQCDGCSQRQIKCCPIHHGQGAGQPKTNRAGLCVGFIRIELSTAPTKELRLSAQLHVDFESYNDGIFFRERHGEWSGERIGDWRFAKGVLMESNRNVKANRCLRKPSPRIVRAGFTRLS